MQTTTKQPSSSPASKQSTSGNGLGSLLAPTLKKYAALTALTAPLLATQSVAAVVKSESDFAGAISRAEAVEFSGSVRITTDVGFSSGFVIGSHSGTTYIAASAHAVLGNNITTISYGPNANAPLGFFATPEVIAHGNYDPNNTGAGQDWVIIRSSTPATPEMVLPLTPVGQAPGAGSRITLVGYGVSYTADGTAYPQYDQYRQAVTARHSTAVPLSFDGAFHNSGLFGPNSVLRIPSDGAATPGNSGGAVIAYTLNPDNSTTASIMGMQLAANEISGSYFTTFLNFSESQGLYDIFSEYGGFSSAVPEPSQTGAIAGAALIALALAKKRMARK